MMSVTEIDGLLPTNVTTDHHVDPLTTAQLRNWSVVDITDPKFDLLRHLHYRGLVIAIYVVIIVVGTVGNSVVVCIVVRNKHLQTVTNVFIANLALSDIGLCVFSLPVQLYYQLADHWTFGEPMCRLVFAAFAVPMYVSTLTIFLIAFDRYWLIVYPLRRRMSLRVALAMIAGVAVTSSLLSVPVVRYTHIAVWNDTALSVYRQYCIETWPTPLGRTAYSVSMFLLQFCAPLTATTLLYYRIYCRLKRRNSRRAARNQDTKQKTNKLLVAIVTVFIICWLPWTLLSLVSELDSMLVRGPHFKMVDVLLRAFAMGSACVNPFIYCWLNDNFRKELDNMGVRLHMLRERPRAPELHVQLAENGVGENGRVAVTVDGASTRCLSAPTTHLELTSVHHGALDDERSYVDVACSTSDNVKEHDMTSNSLLLPRPSR